MAEIEEEFCPTPNRYLSEDWIAPSWRGHWGNNKQISRMLQDIWEYPEPQIEGLAVDEPRKPTTEERFRKLADKWSSEVATISSTKDLVSNPFYREIVNLGWDVVPSLLEDLRHNRGFWFPALYEITKIRPFDPSDSGNTKRMTAAWIAWGKKKGII